MPHLNFATFPGQLFWLVITFVLLYLVVWRAILPRISGVLESRGKIIADDLGEAEQLRNEAEALDKKHEKRLADTAEKARKLIDESTQKAKAALEKKRATLSAQLEEKMAKAEKQIAKIEKDSAAQVEKVVADLSNEIVTKLSKAA